MVRWILVFLALIAVLFGLEMLNIVQTAVVAPWTSLVAAGSAALVRFIDPTVISHGQVLESAHTGFSIIIEPGCNGVEAAIVLVAGMLSFPSPWMIKVWGILIGFVVVQSVNLIRVVTLFFIGEWNLGVFKFAHLYMWQSLIMLDVLIVWLIWVRMVAKGKRASR